MPRGFHDYQQEGHGYTMPLYPALSLSYVNGLRSLRTISYLELHGFAFAKGFKTVPLDGREVYEHVATSVFLGNEAVTFTFVEPFYCTTSQV